MRVAGFTIVRNAVKFDYPVLEAIRSVLPLCDEFYIGLGDSEDSTESLLSELNDPKIKIIHSVWDMTLREGGHLLAVETNKVLQAIPSADWALYIQADEVLHEQSLDKLHNAMLSWKDDPEVEGLLFDYLHFYGSYDYLGDARRWYRHEIRAIRLNKNISSWGDAMGFRRGKEKLRVKRANAVIHHYGWVKPPSAQQAKQESFHKMWHSDQWMKKNIAKNMEFDYSEIDSIELFKGSHPKVMMERINKANWKISLDPGRKKFKLKDRLLYWIEKKTGWRPGEYKNYKLI